MEERTQTDDGPHGILVDAIRSPVTGALCLVAIVFSIAAWAGPGFDPFVTDDRAFRGEPWRLLSSHLVHADGLHFAANLYWTWIFGRFLEPRLGALRLALVVLALAVGVDLACHAFDEGGIGLSGIGYGLWALILVGGRHITAWRGGLPRSVHVMFVIWFFLCIAMTLGGAWNVSNVGHASGALLGAALGLALDAQTRFRSRAVAAFAAGLVALLACATVARPWVNSGNGAEVELRIAHAAYDREDWSAVRTAAERALELDPRHSEAWWLLGVAHDRLGDATASLAACSRASELGELDAERLDYLVDALTRELPKCWDEGRFADGLRHAIRAAEIAPEVGALWHNVQLFAEKVADAEWIERSTREIARLGFVPPDPPEKP